MVRKCIINEWTNKWTCFDPYRSDVQSNKWKALKYFHRPLKMVTWHRNELPLKLDSDIYWKRRPETQPIRTLHLRFVAFSVLLYLWRSFFRFLFRFIAARLEFHSGSYSFVTVQSVFLTGSVSVVLLLMFPFRVCSCSVTVSTWLRLSCYSSLKCPDAFQILLCLH